MENMTENEDKYLNEDNVEVRLLEDIAKEVTEEENIYDHPTEGFLVSYESDSNNPNSETEEDSVALAQHTDDIRDPKDAEK